MLKRVGCEAFFLLERKDRVRFGSRGSRGILLALDIYNYPDYTYLIWCPFDNRVYVRRDVLFNQHAMPCKDARQLLRDRGAENTWLRRGLGQFTRSNLRDANPDLNFDGWENHSNENSQPTLNDLGECSFLPTHDGVASPLQTGDTLFIGNSPTSITAVSPTNIESKHLVTGTVHNTSPQGQFFNVKQCHTRQRTAGLDYIYI